jgi:hypothetical protein
MKNLYGVLALLVVLAVSCSKDSELNNYQGLDQFSGNASYKMGGNIIEVTSGSDNTRALIDAFALAKTIGKNAVVKLLPGTFEIGWMEVREFNGTLAGSGKGQTIITNLPDLSPDALIAQNKVPALITFIGGDVTVSNLSVKLSEGLSWLGSNEMNMLLFSDYAADFAPAKKNIRVNLNNIEVTGILIPDVLLWEGGPVADIPYYNFNGIKFAPDMLEINAIVLRSNIDINVINSNISKFMRGVYVWGLKSGILDFGIKGGNIFSDNNQGLVVNENIGVNVKIWNNEFTVPPYYWDGIDLNTNESPGSYQLENVMGVLGNYNIQNNIFNINNSEGTGIMDAYRYTHPEDPRWMNIIWNKNIFNTSGDYATPWGAFAIKNAHFSDNIVRGNSLDIWLYLLGINWIADIDFSLTEACKFVNNQIISKDVHLYFDNLTKDNMVMGDLTNIIVEDNGVNNTFIGKTNPNHAGAKQLMDLKNRIKMPYKMYQK